MRLQCQKMPKSTTTIRCVHILLVPTQVITQDLQSLSVQARLFKSLKLWSFYVDLEESLGTVETAKAVYDKILELRIANAQVIVNYAAFLEENHYFEESFKACLPFSRFIQN